jgi:hypothetical protein
MSECVTVILIFDGWTCFPSEKREISIWWSELSQRWIRIKDENIQQTLSVYHFSRFFQSMISRDRESESKRTLNLSHDNVELKITLKFVHSSKTKSQIQNRILAKGRILKSASIFQLFSYNHQKLFIRTNSFFVFNCHFNRFNSIQSNLEIQFTMWCVPPWRFSQRFPPSLTMCHTEILTLWSDFTRKLKCCDCRVNKVLSLLLSMLRCR